MRRILIKDLELVRVESRVQEYTYRAVIDKSLVLLFRRYCSIYPRSKVIIEASNMELLDIFISEVFSYKDLIEQYSIEFKTYNSLSTNSISVAFYRSCNKAVVSSLNT